MISLINLLIINLLDFQLQGKFDRRTPSAALLYVTSRAVKAGEFLRVVYRGNNKGVMSAADRDDAAGMAYAN